MQLIHTNTNTPFDLAVDVRVSLERQNAFFAQSGSCSLPFTLPATPLNRRLLGFADRLDTVNTQRSLSYLTARTSYKIPVRLQQGSFVEEGTMMLLSYSEEEGFEVSVIIGESGLWEQLKDVTLKDVLRNKSVTPGTDDDAGYWINLIAGNLLNESGHASLPEELCVCTLYSDKGYINLFRPVHTSNQPGTEKHIYTPQLVYTGNTQAPYEVDGKIPAAPRGLGLTLHLKLMYLIRYLFNTYLGIPTLTIEWPVNQVNNQSWEDVFDRIIIINNTIDTIITGTVFYSTLVPDIKVTDFLLSLFAMFGIGFFTVSMSEVRMCFLQNVIDSTPAADITTLFNRHGGVTFEDTKQLSIAFEHIRKEGDADQTDYEALKSKYHHLFEDEYGRIFDNDNPSSNKLLCYDQFDIGASDNDGDGVEKEAIDNSLSDTRLLNTQEVELRNLIVKILKMESYAFYGTTDYPLYMPVIAGLRNEVCTMQYTEQSTDPDTGKTVEETTNITQTDECPLLLCYMSEDWRQTEAVIHEPGRAETFSTIAEYRFATPYYYHDSGQRRVRDLDLTARGICTYLHTAYKNALKSGAHRLTVHINMSLYQLQNFDFTRPLHYQSRTFLPLTLQTELTDTEMLQVTLELMAL